MTNLQGGLDGDAPLREIPRVQQRPQPKPLAQIVREHERDEAIFHAYANGGYSLQEIGDHFGLHYSRVSRIVKQQRLAQRQDLTLISLISSMMPDSLNPLNR